MAVEHSGQRLARKRVLLVGGGAQDVPGFSDPPIGIGQATAVCLVREGATLLLADNDSAAMKRTIESIESFGGTASAMEADVTSAAECGRIIAHAIEIFGEIDGLVINVGVVAQGGGKGLAGITAEDWDRVFSINVRAGFLLCQAAFAGGLADNASIVFTSSVVALKPTSKDPAYAASKAALVGLSGHVALEGGARGIRSNIVAPGNIDTPARLNLLWRRAGGGDQPRTPSPMLSPVGRQGTGWDIGYMTVFLLSDESTFVTAQILPVDGGLAAIG
jgi:NAD(P)-dependent dehydrogenase (short-subunit alcohol dehydrogenase family)